MPGGSRGKLYAPSSLVLTVETIPVSTFYELGDVGAQASLRVHTHVREDAIQLFGFRTGREKELFLRLTSVSGVGPKLGIAFLSGTSPDDLIGAIRSNDLARLVSIPGVGRKTAERVVIELRDKINQLALPDSDEAAPASAKVDVDATREDVIAALGNDVRAYTAVPAAICSFLAHYGSFADAVTFAIHLGGDTDTIA